MADLVGESLGPYTIVARIGQGGMADVYKALHTGLSVTRAIKVIRPEFVALDDFRARFQKEARAVAQLRHPNIVQVHDFGSHGDAYYMVMEFIEGRDLKKIIAAEGPQPIQRSLDIVLQVAGALEYAHGRGLIHRDIKPENIMMTPAGQPILTDFGIAKLIAPGTQLTQTGFGIGTPSYMAPEQAQGLTDVGPAADIYALCVVLYELLTGRVPFKADTPMAVILKSLNDPLPLPRMLRPDISEAIESVIIKGTAKRSADRYQDVTAFRTALERASRARADERTVVQRTRNDTTTPPRTPVATITGIAAAVMLAAGLAYWQMRTPPAEVAEVAAPPPVLPSTPATIDGGALTFDQPIKGEITKADQRVDYAFVGTVGDTLFFDLTSGTTDFVLYAPDGTALFQTAEYAGPLVLAQSGHYRLSAAPRGEPPASFAYVLWRLTNPSIDGGTIRPNVRVEGHTDLPGQLASYRLDGRAGQKLTFAVEHASESTDFRLVGPSGTGEVFSVDEGDAPVTLPQTGLYTLTVDPRFDRPSRFAFVVRAPVATSKPPQVAVAPNPGTPTATGRSSADPAIRCGQTCGRGGGHTSAARHGTAGRNNRQCSRSSRQRCNDTSRSAALIWRA